jgi:hypothetical protein
MSIEYYISSNKYSLSERITNRGKVYDVRFRVITLDGKEKQKRLGGYANKTLAKQGYLDFVTNKCELVKNNPIKRQKQAEKGKNNLTVDILSKQYFLAIRNQLKDSSIYELQNVFKLMILPK